MKAIKTALAAVALFSATGSFAADLPLFTCKVVDLDRAMLVRFNDIRLEEYVEGTDHYQGDALVKVTKFENGTLLQVGETRFKNAARRQSESDMHLIYAAQAKSGKGYVLIIDDMNDGAAQLFGIFNYSPAKPFSWDDERELIADVKCAAVQK